LDPELLPKLSVIIPRRTPVNVTTEDSLTALAKVFLESDSVNDLGAAVAQVPEIWASRSDRFVVTEMFHVKAWHYAYLRRSYGEFLFTEPLKASMPVIAFADSM
jgi:hypothetical protein